MNLFLSTLRTAGAVALMGLSLTACAKLPFSNFSTKAVATQGYAYGFPLLLMQETKTAMTGPVRVCEFASDVNTFKHIYEVPDPEFRAVVRPNVDTLYSSAFLDLSSHPVVMSLPKVHERYMLMALFDAWSNNFAGLGTTQNQGKPTAYMITGPNFSGVVPDQYTQVKAPTNMVWVIGRTELKSEGEVSAVNALQDQVRLSMYKNGRLQPAAKQPSRCISASEFARTPEEKVKQLTALEFFSRLDVLMQSQPAHDPVMDKLLSHIGVGPKATRTPKDLKPSELTALEEGADYAQQLIDTAISKLGKRGVWNPDPSKVALGDYNNHFWVRAVVSQIGFGANQNQFAVYQNAVQDADSDQLNGAHSYQIHFEPGQTPPVEAFWSVTVYNQDGFLTQNPINRYALGSNSNLTFAADQSLTLTLSHTEPDTGLDNWLPLPKGNFEVTLRMYEPSEPILDSSWSAPLIEKMD